MIFFSVQNTAAGKFFTEKEWKTFSLGTLSSVQKLHVQKATNFQGQYLENLQKESLSSILSTECFYLVSAELFRPISHSLPFSFLVQIGND